MNPGPQEPRACAGFVDIPLSRRCPNVCVFCYSDSRRGGPSVPYAALVRILCQERRRGIRRVHFVGGEPTIHPDFCQILEAAKRIGYDIVVVSNGGRFLSMDFCRQALPYIDELIFSLHGHAADIHERLTQKSGSFKLLRRALDNARKTHGACVSINTTVTALNLDSVMRIARMAVSWQVHKYHLLNVVPLGQAARRFVELMPRLNHCAKVLPRVIGSSWEAGLPVLVAGFPLCVLGPYWGSSLDLSGEYALNRQVKPVVFEKPPGAIDDFRIELGRSRVARCAGCALESHCGGMYGAYYDRYGDCELTPFAKGSVSHGILCHRAPWSYTAKSS